MYRYLFALYFLSLSAFSSSSPEELTEKGLKAYQEHGAMAGITAWLKGSGMEGGKQATALIGPLAQIEAYYSSVEGYEILGVNEITKRSSMVLFVVNYEKGPAYGRIQAYKKTDGNWVVSELDFNTDATSVWPPTLVFGL